VKLFFKQAAVVTSLAGPFSLFQLCHSFSNNMFLTIVFVCLIRTSSPERIIRIANSPVYHVVMAEMSLCPKWLFWDLKKVESPVLSLILLWRLTVWLMTVRDCCIMWTLSIFEHWKEKVRLYTANAVLKLGDEIKLFRDHYVLCSVLFCDIVILCDAVFLLCIVLLVVPVLYCVSLWVRAATITEVFPFFFLSCKANTRV
jgi:hypothetical protein